MARWLKVSGCQVSFVGRVCAGWSRRCATSIDALFFSDIRTFSSPSVLGPFCFLLSMLQPKHVLYSMHSIQNLQHPASENAVEI